jgi:hypothetical protein
MALLMVIMLGLVFSVLAITLFAMASYEYDQVTYRDQSASAFWLAEAAIEHAKALIFIDSLWSAGFDSVPKAEGWYSLTISDTNYAGSAARVFDAQGFVPRATGGYVERRIEYVARITPPAWDFALFAMGYIEARGNPDVCGRVHSNGNIDDGGSSLDQLSDSCVGGDGDYMSEGFVVIPPAMVTEPSFYPATTYYYVVGNPAGAGPAWIVEPDPSGLYTLGSGITVRRELATHGGAQDNITATYTTAGGNPYVEFEFLTTAAISGVFDWTTGKCNRNAAAGDTNVIVNFGEFIAAGPSVPSPAPVFRSNIRIDDNPAYDAPILSSLFNTRYISSDTSEVARTTTTNWTGGNTVLSHAMFLPENGIALLIHDMYDTGPAQIEIGTPDKPAVFYITGSLTGNINANGNVWGTTIVLGVIDRLDGNINFHYDPDFQDALPPYLQPSFWTPSHGLVETLLWREVPPKYQL